MIQPLTFDEFKLHAKEAKYVAVFQEISTGSLTPILIYALLNQELAIDGVMLEDLHDRESLRYSYICFEPLSTFIIEQGDQRDPLEALREFQSQYTYSTRAEVAKLISSAVGFITYDAVRSFETIPDRHAIDSSLPTFLFNFHALSLTFDHERQMLLISILVEANSEPLPAYLKAQEKIKNITNILSTATLKAHPRQASEITSQVKVDTTDTDFIKMVETAKQYIIRGDAFQIVVSRCFKRQYAVSPLTIYNTLRQVSPAPFMFYFPTGGCTIVGASPERFIRVEDQTITVNPIAGTRKHTGKINAEMIKAELLSNQKEMAEHMMLVDLARNDVGAVSNPGSVQVKELLKVKHYSHVSHITSNVQGQLQEKYDAFDAFAAAFPAGTLSGAPKIRAMQIIDELESSRRGLYGGAICRLDLLGNLDSCIAIRMAILKDGIATIRTGAGVVYDSNPADEAQETYQKAQSLLDAIATAHGEEYVINY